MGESVCEECRGEVDEQASTCPHCGYDPGAEIRSQANWRLGVGALLCFTIIGGVIGIPLVISGLRHKGKASDASPAVAA